MGVDGIVDIYLPDFKYSDEKKAATYSSGADTYVGFTQKAILEMYRQVGTARPMNRGLINRGLMIRHLVMPSNISGTKEVIDWIAKNLPKDTYLNLMSQYRPMLEHLSILKYLVGLPVRSMRKRSIGLGQLA